MFTPTLVANKRKIFLPLRKSPTSVNGKKDISSEHAASHIKLQAPSLFVAVMNCACCTWKWKVSEYFLVLYLELVIGMLASVGTYRLISFQSFWRLEKVDALCSFETKVFIASVSACCLFKCLYLYVLLLSFDCVLLGALLTYLMHNTSKKKNLCMMHNFDGLCNLLRASGPSINNLSVMEMALCEWGVVSLATNVLIRSHITSYRKRRKIYCRKCFLSFSQA